MGILRLYPASSSRRVYVPGDIHCPFQDDAALWLMVEHADKYGGADLVIQGDFLDCKGLSTHDKPPGEWNPGLQEESTAADFWLDIFTQAFKTVTWIAGNHEQRIERLQMANPALAGIPWWHIAGLHSYDNRVTFLEYDDEVHLGAATIVHGDTLKGSLSAGGTNRVLANYPLSVLVYGHSHRIASSFSTVHTPRGEKVYGAFNVGHMSKVAEHQRWSRRANHQTGFGVLTLLEDDHSVDVKLHCVVKTKHGRRMVV